MECIKASDHELCTMNAEKIMWPIDSFLGNDRETNNKTTAVARKQILNKQ
jgi:hypothetical protein